MKVQTNLAQGGVLLRRVAGRVRRLGRRFAHDASRPFLEPWKRKVNARWREHVLATGDDVTAEQPQTLLVVAPHPDDETIGCGATIARRVAQGTTVHVVVCSDGGDSRQSSLVSPSQLAELRRAESREACGVLGVPADRVRFLGATPEELRGDTGRLVDGLVRVLDEVSATEVLVVSERDWHEEHRAVNRAARQALAKAGFVGVARAYPVWHWDNGPSDLRPSAGLVRHVLALLRHRRLSEATPIAALVSTRGFEEVKRDAFSRYRTQTTSFTGEKTWTAFPSGWLDKYVDRAEPFFPLTLGSDH